MASHCRKEHSETRYVYGMDGNRLTCPCTAPAVSHLTPTMPSLVVLGDIPSCATMRFGTWQQAFSAKSAVTCRLSPPLYHCLVKLSFTDPPTSLRMQDSTSVPAVFGATDSAARCWRARLPPQRTLFKISFCDQPIHHMPWIAHAPTPPFCGYSSFEVQADGALVVCVTRAKVVFLSVLFRNLVLKLLLRKNYLRCLRFWFGGNLERELGEAFSPPQFTVRESEVSDEDFLCVRKHSQMVSCPLFFFFFFFFFLLLEGLPLIGLGLACLSHPTFFWYFLWTLS